MSLRPGRMRVVAPVRSAAEVAPLARAGADELFCGINPGAWSDRVGAAVSSNQRPPGAGQVRGLEELARIHGVAERLGLPLALALNRPAYSDLQARAALDLAAECRRRAGVDAFIAADPSLVRRLADAGFAVHVSSLANVLNAEDARFFAGLGARRVILPDPLTDDEIGRIIAGNPGLEIEAFAFATGCMHLQGLCGVDHDLDGRADDTRGLGRFGAAGGALWLARNAAVRVAHSLRLRTERPTRRWRPCTPECFDVLPLEGFSDDPVALSKVQAVFAARDLRSATCALCRLWTWARLGVAAVKVIAREMPLEARLRATRAAARLCRKAVDVDDIDKFRGLARSAYRSALLVACPEHACPRRARRAAPVA